LQINAAEAASKNQATQAFTGFFKASAIISSITIGVDGGTGVVATSWVSNGSELIGSDFVTQQPRFYPTNLVRQQDGIEYRAYRGNLFIPTAPAKTGLFSEYNDFWFEVDAEIYNNQPIDTFVAGFDANGVVQSIYPDALKVTLTRTT